MIDRTSISKWMFCKVLEENLHIFHTSIAYFNIRDAKVAVLKRFIKDGNF